MLATIVLNLGYVALVTASFTSALTRLRSLLIAAAFLLAGFAIIEDIPSMVAWNTLIGTSHTARLARDIWLRKRDALCEDIRPAAEAIFPGLNDRDLFALWTAGSEARHHNTQILSAGSHSGDVGLVVAGHLEVRHDQRVIAHLEAGSLVGEMSFARDGIASADVHACGTVRLRVWTTEALDRLEHTNPAAAAAFARLVQHDLADKLAKNPTPASVMDQLVVRSGSPADPSRERSAQRQAPGVPHG